MFARKLGLLTGVTRLLVILQTVGRFERPATFLVLAVDFEVLPRALSSMVFPQVFRHPEYSHRCLDRHRLN